jgi:hypothetical protein
MGRADLYTPTIPWPMWRLVCRELDNRVSCRYWRVVTDAPNVDVKLSYIRELLAKLGPQCYISSVHGRLKGIKHAYVLAF